MLGTSHVTDLTCPDYPIPAAYLQINYLEFVGSQVANTQDVLISQTICRDYFSAIFAPNKLYKDIVIPKPSWALKKTHDEFVKFVAEMKTELGLHVVSLAVDDKLGFGVFCHTESSGLSVSQEIVWSDADDEAALKELIGRGFSVTACGAQGARVYYVLTKGATWFQDRKQERFSGPWRDIKKRIAEQASAGQIITSICYSTGRSQYVLVTTQSEAKQCFRWRWGAAGKGAKEDREWENSWHEKGRHPTILFKDPTDMKVFEVLTEDENRTSFKTKLNYPIKK